jgi:hypothetical protein
MVKYVKNKFMKFSEIFKDKNDFNEKNIVGFASFAMMVLFAIADITTGFFGKDLVVQEFIYNSFVIITLGSFGIDGITKIFKKSNTEETE